MVMPAMPRNASDENPLVGQDVILRAVVNRALRRLAIGAQVSNLPHTLPLVTQRKSNIDRTNYFHRLPT